VFGNLKVPDVLTDAMVQNTQSMKHNGYLPMLGSEAARKAVAQSHSPADFPVTKDVRLITDRTVLAKF
jgi:hypothetical protein